MWWSRSAPTAYSAIPTTSPSARQRTRRFTGSRPAPHAGFGGCATVRCRSRSSAGGTSSARQWGCSPSSRPGCTTCGACRTTRIGITVDCRPVADRKVAGLGEHRSQHHVMSDDPSDTERWKRLVGREWWVVAWPERPPGAPMLGDIFEGLD